jgi:hypothetical protein
VEQRRFDMILGKQRARGRLREFIRANLFSYKNARVLCLPGENGREIEHVYRKLGFQDKNIVGVEMDPHAARGVRIHYPGIDVREGDLHSAVKAIVVSDKEEPFDVVSLDFCGQFSLDKLTCLRLLQTAGKLKNRCVIATNFFAGREKRHTQNVIRLEYSQAASEGESDEEAILALLNGEEIATTIDSDVPLGVARDHAPRRATINELTHYAAMLRLSRVHRIVIGEREIDDLIRVRNRPITERADFIRFFMGNSSEAPGVACTLKIFELQNILETTLRMFPGAIRFTNNNNPSTIAFALARRAMELFIHAYGRSQMLTAHAGYSYINDAGHKMISDFSAFRYHEDKLNRQPTIFVPDGCGSIELCPTPRSFGHPLAYVEYVNDVGLLIARTLKRPNLQPVARIDLGGGALPIDHGGTKNKIVAALKRGRTDDEIMAKWPVTIGTLRALRANITMGRT